MKILKNILSKKTLITWIALSFTALLFTSCLNQKSESSSGTEERTIVEDGNSTSLTPSIKSWPALGGICSNSNFTEVEAVVCKLDDLLDEVAKSGKPLSDFENDIKSWVQSAADIRNQVCKNSKDMTFLVVGTLEVLAARNLIKLPVDVSSLKDSSKINFFVKKIVYNLAIESIHMGCEIDKSQLQKYLTSSAITPGIPDAGKVDNGRGGSSGDSTGGSIVGPPKNGGGSKDLAVCQRVELRFKAVCKPYCTVTNSCDVTSCEGISKYCLQNKCVCN